MGYKKWTDREMEYLEDNWGYMTIPGIAKKLNRSIEAIRSKSIKMKLGRHIHQGDYVTLNSLMIALGFNNGCNYLIERLKKKGFPIKYRTSIKVKYKVVDLEEFWKWTEENKQLLSFARFEKGALGAEPKWVDEKRKADMKNPSKRAHNRNWTKEHDNTLVYMCKANRYTYADIAKELNRTEGAVKRRLYDLGVPYRPVPRDSHIKWTDEDNKKMIELYNKGYDSNAIAIALNKTQLSICDRLKKFRA